MAPGVLILTAIFTSIFGGVNTLWDRRYGFMNKALTSPISRSSIALGKMLAISMIAAFQSSLILGMALALGVSMPQLWMIAPIMGIVISILNWLFRNFCYGCSCCKIPRNILGNN